MTLPRSACNYSPMSTLTTVDPTCKSRVNRVQAKDLAQGLVNRRALVLIQSFSIRWSSQLFEAKVHNKVSILMAEFS